MNLNNTPSRGPLTASDLKPFWPPRRGGLPADTFPGCHGPCDQGRKLCPVPEACEAPTREPFDAACVIVWVMGTIGAWAAIIAFLLALRA